MLNRLYTLEHETMLTRYLLLIYILAAPAISAADVGQRSECNKVKQKIRHVQARMRAGYTRAQGEKLEAELRRLRTLRIKTCRR